MEENMSSTQEKPRDRVMALPEKLRKELLYLAHLDPERQKSTLLHNVAVSGEKIQQLIDSAKREARGCIDCQKLRCENCERLWQT